MNKILIYILFYVLSNLFCIAENIQNYAGIRVNDTVRVINKSIDFDARIYIFTNMDACNVCNTNINVLYQNYGLNCEFIVFVDNANENDLISIKKNFDGKYKFIGDEFGLYKAYYKINFQPLILILDNDGIVFGYDKVGGKQVNIDSTLLLINSKNSKNKIKDTQKSMIEINRIKVKINNSDFITSLFRECLFKKNDQSYVLVNMRKPDIFFIDSSGNVSKTLSANKFTNYKLDFIQDFSWAFQDSIIFLYGNDDKNTIIQYYNVYFDNFSKYKELSPISLNHPYSESFNACFLTDKKRFVNNNRYYFAHDTNLYLSDSDTIGKIFNMDGNIIKTFDKPDLHFKSYRQSKHFSMIFGYSNDVIYTIQNFTNNLQRWDHEGNLQQTNYLDLGNYFRKIDIDFQKNSNFQEYAILNNKISKFERILVDNTTANILIVYKNETYPSGIVDFMSDKVKWEIVLNIYNQYGVKLNDLDVILPKGTIPFFFENNIIYTTEINGNKLEIVKYLFKSAI